MSQLQLTLHQPYAYGRVEAGAIASVRLLADTEGKTVRSWWSSEKPVSIFGDVSTRSGATVFDLPGGGIYGVEITRPRGPSIYREFRVSEGERHAETISLEASPHEYLSWQQYAGIVRANPDQRETVSIPSVTKSSRLVTLLQQSQAQIDSLYGGVKGIPETFAADIPAARDAWTQVGEAIRGDNRSWATATPLPDLKPNWDNEYVTWFLGSPEPDEGIKLIKRLKKGARLSKALPTKYPRWMAFNTEGKVDLASVPWPWWGAHKEENENIQVVYDRVRPSAVDHAVPGRLTVSVIDYKWFGLLEFLASGRLSRTGAMFDQVLKDEHPEELFDPELALYGKVKGPLVATAGAIVLIARANSTEKQHWDQWVENLSSWFPGIPDGLILLGCRRVDQARNIADFRAAYRLLEDGVARGIPFFAATILMLSVRLSQMAEDLTEADKLRRFIAPVSTRVDSEQVFTVIRV